MRGVADVAVPDDVDAGMGAWHVNAVDELHVVQSGEGIMEFVTLDGVVSVVVGAGDVIEIRGAEHRYRPLTEQRWSLRHSGGPHAELSATEHRARVRAVARAPWRRRYLCVASSTSRLAMAAGTAPKPAGSRMNSPVPCVMLRMSIA